VIRHDARHIDPIEVELICRAAFRPRDVMPRRDVRDVRGGCENRTRAIKHADDGIGGFNRERIEPFPPKNNNASDASPIALRFTHISIENVSPT